jgi:hypothetical protein
MNLVHSAVSALLAGLVLLPAAGCKSEPESLPRQAEVTINGHTFRVELAMTEARRHKGLGGRTRLAEDQGMLFIFRRAERQTFVMRNCEIPIDVAFLDADRRIVRIHEMQVEWDRSGRVPYSSGGPAQYALEVAGGVFAKLGIEEGDVVEFSDRVPPPAKAEP